MNSAELDWSEHTAQAIESRSLFSFDDEGENPDLAYLNAAYMIPLLKEAVKAATVGCEIQSKPWKLKYPDEFTCHVEDARSTFARIIGSDPSDVAVLPSVAYAVATASKHLKSQISKGDKILLLDGQYTSNALAWQQLALETEAEVVFVPPPQIDSSENWTDNILLALEKYSPSLTALPASCHWCDGAGIDMVKVADLCHSIESIMFIDGTQSIGVVPFDLDRVRPDYLAVASYKWLCCPYSLAFLYVAPKHHHRPPLEMHGLARKNGGFLSDGSYDVQQLFEIRDTDYVAGARRFDSGQNSNFVTLKMAVVGLEQTSKWLSSDYVATHTRPLLDYLCEKVSAIGMIVPPLGSRSPHIVGLRFPKENPKSSPSALKQLAVVLKKRSILVSIRGDAVRVAPHVWSTKDDMDRLFDALHDYAKK